MTYMDVNPRSYFHVLCSDKCLIMYTKWGNSMAWDWWQLDSPTVRDVGGLSASSCSNESEHGLDFGLLTFQMTASPSHCWLLYTSFLPFFACSWTEADTFCLVTCWSKRTHFWSLLPTNLFADGKEKKFFRFFRFSTKMGIFPLLWPSTAQGPKWLLRPKKLFLSIRIISLGLQHIGT